MGASKPQKDLAYLKQCQLELAQSRPISVADFKSFCLLALEVKRAFPEDRAEIAYSIACIGKPGKSKLEDSIPQQIMHLAFDLEIPDPHVFTGDGLSVVQKWAKLESLVEQLPAE
jgi:hypothetical protein